ncbi:DNA repair protein RecO [uncultured Finegoldia sp.]|uniref:DNA repair protein RecO n=1 Tax=uncultured Finegoldia sp. TaxID=328009 RepID=UPI0026225A13|nr:DNA repair protein RecO [uncultured Finegoldia sp.]
MAESFLKTQAIVLEHIIYGENSVILNVFTKDNGIIGIFINNISSKNSLVEFNVLSVSDFTLRKSNQFYYLVDYDLINSNFNIRTNYKSELFSLVIVDLIKSIFYNEVCNEKVYALILKTVIYLSEYTDNQNAIINAFILKLVSYLGYQPSMFYEANHNKFYLNGGFTESNGEFYNIDNLHSKYMIYLMKNKYEDIVDKKYNGIDENKILKILLKYTINNFGIEYLGSLGYLEYL